MASAEQDSCCSGFIPKLREILSKRRNVAFHLCDPSMLFFFKGWKDRGWGCGFRNLQNLTGCLLKHDLYKKHLFNGMGVVPKIKVLQEMLDYAHGQGFDPTGLREIGAVAGSNRWIGSVDV